MTDMLEFFRNSEGFLDTVSTKCLKVRHLGRSHKLGSSKIAFARLLALLVVSILFVSIDLFLLPHLYSNEKSNFGLGSSEALRYKKVGRARQLTTSLKVRILGDPTSFVPLK